MPDNIGHMFYYGERPWHRKGMHLQQPANALEALRAGGLEWEVKLIPLRTAEEPPSHAPQRMAVVRTDRASGTFGRVIGVVHPGFRPLQNREGARLFDALIGQGKRVYHTGGYLGNGEVIWLLARLPVTIRVHGDDVVEPYMLFTNSHDGSIAIDFRLTTVRVVCQNTLNLALSGRKKALAFKQAHQGSYEALLAKAEQFFQFSLEVASEVGNEFQAMNGVWFHVHRVQEFTDRLLPLPQRPTPLPTDGRRLQQYEARCQAIEETRAAIQEVFTAGISNGVVVPPAEESLWGALNAVTAFVDHLQPIGGDRYAHSLFGAGAALKQKAYRLAQSYLEETRAAT